MKKNHNFFSNLAFDIAVNNVGRTKDNPSVGCVVVKNNTVISSGLTSVNGRPHAEYNALNKNLNFNGADMYLTLEPCTHYGQTPPCTNLIKKKRIKTVYYSFDDPDIRTNQKAKKVLNKKIKKVKKIDHKNKDFYNSYFLNKNKELPLVDAKIAFSKDNFTISKKKRWITNYRSRNVTHLLRSRYDSIISTSTTINKDNSLLNTRIEGLDYFKPDLIIIDRHLKLKKNLKLFSIAKTRKTFIVTTEKNIAKFSIFKKKNIKIIQIKKLEEEKDFLLLLKIIFNLGKRRVFVEAGLIFLNKMLELNLINNLYIFKSGNKLSKAGYNNANISFYKKRYKSKQKLNVNLDEDELFKIRIK